MRKIVPLSNITPVVAGASVTVSCPLGLTYEKIALEYAGVTLAQIKNIEVRLNGIPIQSFKDGTRAKAINDYYGRPENAGFLTLYFYRPELTNIGQRRLMAIGTAAGVQNLSVHFDVDAGAAAPVIKAHSVVSRPRPLGPVCVVKNFPRNDSTAGQIEIDNVPRGPRILAAHLFKADVSDVEVEINQNKFYDASKALSEAFQKENGRVPQTASCTHVDFCLDNDVANALVTAAARDLRFRCTLDTSGATDVVVEYQENLGPRAA